MNELPLWPPILALTLAFIGYIFMRVWARRLDREEAELRRTRSPAE